LEAGLDSQPYQQQGEEHLSQQQQQGEGDVASSVHEDSCIICFSDYTPGDLLKELPCKHYYHATCIDQWLLRSGNCPLCKMPVWQPCAGRLSSNDSSPQQQQQQQQQLDHTGPTQGLHLGASSAAAAAAASVAPLASSPRAAAA
jgi:hypothetical protein